ncbi:MAG TPA: tyrosine-type recombinase/integrase [Ktedonobacteraceae bacterium]
MPSVCMQANKLAQEHLVCLHCLWLLAYKSSKRSLGGVDIKVVVPLSKEQQRLQVAVMQNQFPIMIARDKAILAVLLDTGIRASQLCSVMLAYVHLGQDGYLKIMGKGRREREVPPGKKSRQLPGEYIKRHCPRVESQIVFLSHRSETHSASCSNAGSSARESLECVVPSA